MDVLDDLRKSIIHKAVTRGVDEKGEFVASREETIELIPRHWKRTKFRYEIHVRSGDFVSDKLDDEGPYPVIGGNGLMGRTHDFNVDGEVVVVGRVGAYCGNVHYVTGRAWVSDNALIVESHHNKRFLTYLLRALDLNSYSKKTAQPLVTGTQIKNTYVALPPAHEQRQIAEYLESKSAQIKDVETNLSAQIATLEQYRKSLIHECVTGKRRINKEESPSSL
jgi:type I restriction enzyme S subunit